MGRKESRARRGKVFISGFDEAQNMVDDIVLAVEDSYDGSCQLIDAAEYRRQRGIRVVRGAIYDLDGHLDQQFENRYDGEGEYEEGRAVHSDGQTFDS